MSSNFEAVAQLIITAEGTKESNDPNDYGGKTKFGISQRAYPDLDISNLTQDQALRILKNDYWDKYGVGIINNQGIANQVFFLLVNMNPLKAISIVQVAVNAVGQGRVKVNIDGILGVKTLEAINALADGWLSNRIRLEAIHYYLRLTDNDPKTIPEFRGWVRRALMQ